MQGIFGKFSGCHLPWNFKWKTNTDLDEAASKKSSIINFCWKCVGGEEAELCEILSIELVEKCWNFSANFRLQLSSTSRINAPIEPPSLSKLSKFWCCMRLFIFGSTRFVLVGRGVKSYYIKLYAQQIYQLRRRLPSRTFRRCARKENKAQATISF